MEPEGSLLCLQDLHLVPIRSQINPVHVSILLLKDPF
jgi:hypothetical protein